MDKEKKGNPMKNDNNFASDIEKYHDVWRNKVIQPTSKFPIILVFVSKSSVKFNQNFLPIVPRRITTELGLMRASMHILHNEFTGSNKLVDHIVETKDWKAAFGFLNSKLYLSIYEENEFFINYND